MSKLILLDSGPLGVVANPLVTPATDACNRWLFAQLAKGTIVAVPEIADYEVRRELLRAGKTHSLAKLDGLKNFVTTQPLLVVRRESEPTTFCDEPLNATVSLEFY